MEALKLDVVVGARFAALIARMPAWRQQGQPEVEMATGRNRSVISTPEACCYLRFLDDY
jgi:hypothetical protein